MAQKCSVPNCKSDETVIQHKFPLYDGELFRMWIMRTSNRRLPPSENLQIYETYTVCEKHFIDECIVGERRELKQFALPTIDCPGFYGAPTIENSYPASYFRRIRNSKSIISNKAKAANMDHCYTGKLPQPPETVIRPQAPKTYTNKKNTQEGASPPLPTLFIDLDKEVFEPEEDTILVELDDVEESLKTKIKYNYGILNKNLNKSKSMQPIILDLDGENYIVAQTTSNELATLDLDENPPIYDLTADDEPPLIIENNKEDAPTITEVIDPKKVILDRIEQKKKLLIKKRLEMEEESKLTILKPTAISFVPVAGSYKTTVYVHDLFDKTQYKNAKMALEQSLK